MFEMLSAEQLASRRISFADAEIDFGKNKNWHCHYCNSKFTNEVTFMKHHCEPKRRVEELASPLGQAAFNYYRDWMKLRKYSPPGAAAFMESKYYRTFIKFTQLIIDANIARPEKYMQIMVENNILPVLWCRDNAYALYLDWYDKLSHPLDQVQETINYLFDICEKEEVDISNIFLHLGPQRVLSLIRQRRLTPWLLFCSSGFSKLLKNLNASQLTAFNQIVRAEYWTERFKKDNAIVENVIQIAKEIGL